MANYKMVTLKDPVTGDYLIPRVPRSLAYDILDDGSLQSPISTDADTLGGKPASDYMLKSEYTPVDLSSYLQTSVADTKYAAINHTHTPDSIGAAAAAHTHTANQITGGKFAGTVTSADNIAIETQAIRTIYGGTTDIGAGASLATGVIYLVYE